MGVVRVTLLKLLGDSLMSRLNFLGVRTMVEQAGLPSREASYGDLKSIEWLPSDVLVVPDCEQLCAREWRAVRQFGRAVPVVYTGIPRAELLAEVGEWFGLRDVSVDRSGALRALGAVRRVGDAAIRRRPRADSDVPPVAAPRSPGAPASIGETMMGRFNGVPHLLGRPADGVTTRDLSLGDGTPLSPALILKHDGEEPPRCLFTFPCGYLFARRTAHHIDLRREAETLGWPVDLTIDSVRADLTGALSFLQPRRTIVRRWFWPVSEEGEVPTGTFTLTHDLCGFNPEGLQFIDAVCKVNRIVTTFFDYPPFRLQPGDAEGHVVALHVPGSATQDEIGEGIAELERRHGRKIRGWRRHGSTEAEHYPGIWRRMEQAGIEWTNTFPAQSHPNRSLCSPVGTGNRLPFRRIDIESGEELRQIELPVFDTDDADHLMNIHYGMRLTRQEFEDVVAERLRASASLGLASGYLLHGWTAGIEDGAGVGYGAQDCRDMVTFASGLARELGMAVMDCETMYDWWCARAQAETTVAENGTDLRAPDAGFRVAWEVRSGPKTAEALRARITGPAEVTTDERGRLFVVLGPGQSCRLRA